MNELMFSKLDLIIEQLMDVKGLLDKQQARQDEEDRLRAIHQAHWKMKSEQLDAYVKRCNDRVREIDQP